MDRVKEFSDALRLKGSPYNECFGFIDGTVRAICRPGVNQREVSNCLKSELQLESNPKKSI